MQEKMFIYQLENAKEELSYICDDIEKKIPEDIKDVWVTEETTNFIEKVLSTGKQLNDIIEELIILQERIKKQ